MAETQPFTAKAVKLGRGALPTLASIAVALGVCYLAIGVTQVGFSNAAAAYGQMFWGGFGDFPAFFAGEGLRALTGPWGEAATKAALLTLTGLSVAAAFAVGLFNIGAQGQMLVGALLAALLGAQLRLPATLHLPACLLAAAVGGGLYGWIPAWLKLRRGIHEVLSTIMLNWVAVTLIEDWLVPGPLRAASTGSLSRSGTAPIFPSAHLPLLLGESSRMNLGFPLAMLLALLTWLWLSRTWHGFETRAVGLNPLAADTSGIPVRRRMVEAMVLSGALAGLAGAVLVQGTEFQYPAILSAPYGFDGIAIAMLGQGHPLGTAAVALLFGALRAGGTRMQLFHVHKSFPELIQGLALLLIAAQWAWERLFSPRPKPSSPPGSPLAGAPNVHPG